MKLRQICEVSFNVSHLAALSLALTAQYNTKCETIDACTIPYCDALLAFVSQRLTALSQPMNDAQTLESADDELGGCARTFGMRGMKPGRQHL